MHSNTSGFLNRTNAKNILTELAEFAERLLDKALDPSPAGRRSWVGAPAWTSTCPARPQGEDTLGSGVGRRGGRGRGLWSISASVCLRGPASVVRPTLPLGVGSGGFLPPGSCFSLGLRKAGCPRQGLRVDKGLESRNRVGLRGAWGGEAGSGWVSGSGRVWGSPSSGR